MTYLNLKGTDRTRFLYRITSVQRFVEGLATHENVLVQPERWEDPFEGIILNAYGVLPNGATVMFRLRRNYFGQCWSLHRETDLMWRAYSPNASGVKLRVRADKLHDSLACHKGATAEIRTFLGRVSYQRRQQFHDTLSHGCHFGPPSESQARALLLKRYGFRSEQEVRLIAYAEHGSAGNSIRYPVDWNDLVTEAVLDPRMCWADTSRARAKIREAGYKGRLVQSSLYKPPSPPRFGMDVNGAPRPEK